MRSPPFSKRAFRRTYRLHSRAGRPRHPNAVRRSSSVPFRPLLHSDRPQPAAALYAFFRLTRRRTYISPLFFSWLHGEKGWQLFFQSVSGWRPVLAARSCSWSGLTETKISPVCLTMSCKKMQVSRGVAFEPSLNVCVYVTSMHVRPTLWRSGCTLRVSVNSLASHSVRPAGRCPGDG